MKSLPRDLDFSVLESLDDKGKLRCAASSNRIAFEENKHKFTKVGFDIFREDASNSLWQLEAGEDGEWLIRADIVDESAPQGEVPVQAWNAIPHKDGKAVTLAYCKTPVALFSGQQFKFTPHEASVFSRYLTEKLSSKDFQRTLVGHLPQERKQALQQQHPELFR